MTRWGSRKPGFTLIRRKGLTLGAGKGFTLIPRSGKAKSKAFTLIATKGSLKGFTLIESLTVVMIIGILMTLAAYLITQAQRQARDAVRKSDVSAIAQGFEARFLDKTCLNQAETGYYPGIELIPASGRMPWTKVEALSAAEIDSCNPFSTYLSIIPQDPKEALNDYYFNLSTGATLKAKHYRVAARLEKVPTEDQWLEICRLSDVWYEDFGGEKYGGCGGTIGQLHGNQWLAGLFGWLGLAEARTAPVVCGPGEIPDPNNPNNCIPDTGGGNTNTGGNTTNNGGGDNEPCTPAVLGGPPPEDCPGGTTENELPYNYYIGR